MNYFKVELTCEECQNNRVHYIKTSLSLKDLSQQIMNCSTQFIGQIASENHRQKFIGNVLALEQVEEITEQPNNTVVDLDNHTTFCCALGCLSIYPLLTPSPLNPQRSAHDGETGERANSVNHTTDERANSVNSITDERANSIKTGENQRPLDPKPYSDRTPAPPTPKNSNITLPEAE